MKEISLARRGGGIFLFSLLLTASLLLAGCEKTEHDSNLIEIFAEPLDAGAKVRVDGNDGSWVDGDKICLNGATLSVERHEGHSYLPCETPLAVNRAVYPASLADGSALGSDEVTLTFPAIYHYQTDALGNQLLELPMAARSTDNNPLEFKHLTGALCFVVHNTSSVPLTLQSLVVKSNKYKLNGTWSIDFSNIESLSAVATDVTANRQLRMFFDTGYVLPAGEALNVMLPVSPVGSDNHFTVELRYHTEGATLSFLYNRSQDATVADRTLLRNQLGYAGIDLTNAAGGNIIVTPLLETNPYISQIYTPHDLYLWHTAVNGKYAIAQGHSEKYYGNKCIIMNDIDMTGYTFTPIMEFQSTLDGNNHTISNLTLLSCKESSSNSYICGLFKNNEGDNSITNLTLDNLTLKHTQNISDPLYMGTFYVNLVENKDYSTFSLSNCTANISEIDISGTLSGAIYFGGLISQANKAITISNCHTTTPSKTISARNIFWGGFVGSQTSKLLTINNSSWTGAGILSSTVNTRAGGLVGSKAGSNLTVDGCQVNGTINATVGGSYHYLASLIGQFSNRGTITLTNNTIDVTIKLNGENQTVENYN